MGRANFTTVWALPVVLGWIGACSGSYQTASSDAGINGGTDASNDSATEADVGSQMADDAADEPAPTDSTCATMPHTACETCCAQIHAQGYQLGLQEAATCACPTCAGACATEYCASPPQDSQTGDACDTCFRGTSCPSQVQQECDQNADCVAYLACANCP
jgi:hypothetical protein